MQILMTEYRHVENEGLRAQSWDVKQLWNTEVSIHILTAFFILINFPPIQNLCLRGKQKKSPLIMMNCVFSLYFAREEVKH